MSLNTRSPFDLPELRFRIGCYLSIPDAISCSIVCKDWTNDFSNIIWHTIDLKQKSKVAKMINYGLPHHGHRIRVIENLQESKDIALLDSPYVAKLQSISISLHDTGNDYSRTKLFLLRTCFCRNIISRNRDSLTFISINSLPPNNPHFNTRETITPPSELALMLLSLPTKIISLDDIEKGSIAKNYFPLFDKESNAKFKNKNLSNSNRLEDDVEAIITRLESNSLDVSHESESNTPTTHYGMHTPTTHYGMHTPNTSNSMYTSNTSYGTYTPNTSYGTYTPNTSYGLGNYNSGSYLAEGSYQNFLNYSRQPSPPPPPPPPAPSLSRLTHLQLYKLSFTRDVFSILLQLCPLLDTLDIKDMLIYNAVSSAGPSPSSLSHLVFDWNGPEGVYFQHQKLTCLIAKVEQLFLVAKPENNFDPSPPLNDINHPSLTSDVNTSESANDNLVGMENSITPTNDPPKQNMAADPTILVYFPNLTQWRTWLQYELGSAHSLILRSQINRWNPKFNQVCIEANPKDAMDMLTKSFQHLNLICLDSKKLSVELIEAIQRQHSETLEVFMVFDPFTGFYDIEQSPDPDDLLLYIPSLDNAFQQLLHSCPKIKEFQMPELVMDLDEIERVASPWACQRTLEVFCVRIRGFDTKEKITSVMQLFIQKKKLGLAKLKPSTKKIETEEVTLEERLVNYLLRFDRLKEIWLGTKVWRV